MSRLHDTRAQRGQPASGPVELEPVPEPGPVRTAFVVPDEVSPINHGLDLPN